VSRKRRSKNVFAVISDHVHPSSSSHTNESLRVDVLTTRSLWSLKRWRTRIISMPDEMPAFAVAVGGNESIALTVEQSTDRLPQTPARAWSPDTWRLEATVSDGAGAFSYDKDESKAREFAMRFKFGLAGSKVMS
jgi:hypothetical protein